MSEPLYLIDGYSVIYRSYFAFIRRPLRNQRGENTSAVFGFFRALFQLLRLRHPQALVVVMDSRAPTFRHERYPEYKATRDRAPQDLSAQIPVVERILEALAVPCIREEGFEADDVMATLAERCREQSRECFILSGDKDILQVVGRGVRVIQPPKGGEEFAVLDREGVFAARGLYPEQVADFLALTGDSSDNVPGVAGVGEKTAVKLLGQYGDLDALYRRIEEVQPESLRRKLLEGREKACLSLELVRLRRDVPLELTGDSFTLADMNPQAALPLFAEQGMNSLVEELGGSVARERGLDRLEPGSYELVLDPEALERWVADALRRGVFAFDTETDGLDPLRAGLVGFSLAVEAGSACYVPVRAADLTPLPWQTIRESLSRLLGDPECLLVGQNIKFDFQAMHRAGVEVRSRLFDTMIAAWLLDSERSSYGLDNLAQDLLHYRTLHYQEVVGKDKSRSLADVETSLVCDYAGEDAEVAFRLYRVLSPRLEQEGLEGLFRELEMPLVRILAQMEIAGIGLDVAALREFSKELERELARLEAEIFACCGHPFNVRSTRELQVVLFQEQGLKPTKKTSTGLSSTDNSVLLELAAGGSAVAELVLSHRLLAKLKSTYVDALPALVSPETERIHTDFVQTGAATGRLASRNPNLQNIPVREEIGRRIRAAFVPSPGWYFLSADYAQIELVILAHLSQDPMLLQGFAQQLDIHRRTASILFGVPETQVEAWQRRVGKTINFGVIYGMSAFRLARDLKISRSEAGEFIRRYFERYAGVERLIRDTIALAARQGYVETIMGRRRRLPRIASRNRTERMAAERMAVNSPIQGSAADIVKKAMIDVTAALRRAGMASRLLLQVHDELIFEVPEEELGQARSLVKTTMEQAVVLSAPLRVSVEAGRSWGEIH